ncbi:hypothetical protein ACJMK2_016691 [Sinanodonta woodiana]|uniref:PCI domain-containing protein n=1 Tax=Sinanodonta woodiana TaxID=1069815 RepID=A0ABD3UUH1_SINWO
MASPFGGNSSAFSSSLSSPQNMFGQAASSSQSGSLFGQSNTFGQQSGSLHQSSPFGQSTSFGQQMATQSNTLFDQSTQQSGSHFGQSTSGFGESTGGFGQSAGGFGQSTGGFGQSAGGFGQSAGGFGQSAGGFGQFGQQKSIGLGIGSSQSLFGTSNSTSSPFSQTNTPSGCESSSGSQGPAAQSGFGLSNLPGQNTTSPTPSDFGASSPFGKSATFTNSGFSTTLDQGTTLSFSGFGTSNPFGQSTLTVQSGFGISNPFGQNITSAQSGFGMSSPFGQTISTQSGSGTTSAQSGFGTKSTQSGFGTSSSFGQNTASPFSQTASVQGGFGTSHPFGQSTTATQSGFGTSSPFGQGPVTTQSGFGTSGPFGQNPVTTQSGFGTSGVLSTASTQNVFGTSSTLQQNTIEKPAGQSGFGNTGSPAVFGTGLGFGTANQQTATSQSGFGNTGNPAVFGTGSGFGTANQQTATSQSGFGNTGNPAVFGTGSGFGTANQQTATSQSGFGNTGNPAVFGTGSGFGTANQQTATSQSGFGNTGNPAVFGTGSGFGTANQQTATSQSGFGNTGNPAVFGTGSGFGTANQQTATSQSGFGNTGNPAVFGTGSGFGTANQQTATSQSGFGNTGNPAVFGTGSGFGTANQQTATSQSGFGNTGNPAVFGTGSGFGTANQQTATSQSGFGNTGNPAVFGTGSGFGTANQQTATAVTQSTPAPPQSGLYFSNTASGSTVPPAGLFSSGSGQPGSKINSGLGMVATSPDKTSSASAISPSSLKQKSLFSAMASPEKKAKQSGSLFGKGETTHSAGLFGKGRYNADSTALFGKTSGSVANKTTVSTITQSAVIKTESEDMSSRTGPKIGLFGKPIIKQEAEDVKQESEDSKQGLFGKPVIKREDKQDDRQERGLFGKPKQDDLDDEEASGSSHRSIKRESRQAGLNEQGQASVKNEDESLKRPRKKSDEDGPLKRPVLRRMSSATDDLSSRVALVCKNIPAKFNNIRFLRQHFSKFGPVTRIFPVPVKNMATVHFQTHDAAEEAKAYGRFLGRGIPQLIIFWGSYGASSPGKTASTVATSEDEGKKEKKGIKRLSDGTGSKTSTKRPSWEDSEVNEELRSMSGTHDLMGDKVSTLSRPKDKTVKKTEQVQEKKVRQQSTSPTPSASASEMIKTETVSLANFINSVGRTTAERNHILEMQDKYIRQILKKQKGEKDMSGAYIGTCLDMCPERERYYREETRRLSVYEMTAGTENVPGKNPWVDHSRAVKEYLRPSPDQDITQQQLCNRGAVGLIEKCARFHIYCSERLCEEDMHTFDAKINNENLTKCLQTLKELYHDLWSKQKIACPYEAEFRAYMVLMNLNEGDILREVQQLRPEIRNTHEIDFALKVYSALNSSNYVRFFKLVKDGSFMNACIMHRYFTQVRSRALITMMKSYSMSSKPAQIPLTELVRVLAFELEEEARQFCHHYGFSVQSGPDGDVILDKNAYIEPETTWAPYRSVKLIESRLMVSPGEVMYGESFPPFTLSTPASSFDENGRFVSQLNIATLRASVQPQPTTSDQQQQQLDQPLQQQQQQVLKPSRSEIRISNEVVKELARMLFLEIIDEFAKNLAMEAAKEVEAKLRSRELMAADIIQDLINSLTKDISVEVYNEAIEMKLKQEAAEREVMKDRVAAMLQEEIQEEVLRQLCFGAAVVQMREVHEILTQQRIERCSADVNDDHVNTFVSSMMLEIAEEVYEKDVVQRLKDLEDIERSVKLSRAGHYFQKWKKTYSAVTKLKRSMLAFPSAPFMGSISDQIKNLTRCQESEGRIKDSFYISNRAKLTIISPMALRVGMQKAHVMMSAHEIYAQLVHERAQQPLDLTKVVGQKLLQKLSEKTDGSIPKEIFWKLVICFPDADPDYNRESYVTAKFVDWLQNKFSKGTKPEEKSSIRGELCSLYRREISFPSHRKAKQDQSIQLGICVRTLLGVLEEEDIPIVEEEKLLLGTSGAIFVLPIAENAEDEDSHYWMETRGRLFRFLDAKPVSPALPLVILVPARASQKISTSDLCHQLNLNSALNQGLVSDVYTVFVQYDEDLPEGINTDDPLLSEQICESLQWLAERAVPPPQLAVVPLKDYVENFLMSAYHTPVLQNLKTRKSLGFLHQEPLHLLDLYNSVVQHLKDVATSSSLCCLSWPVAEFTRTLDPDLPPAHWNSEVHLDYLSVVLHTLVLPTRLSPLDTEDWSSVVEEIWDYVKEVIGDDCSSARVKLVTRIKRLLKRVEEDFEDTCYLLEGENMCEPTCANVPWVEIIAACVDYRLVTLDVKDPNYTKEDLELRIAYDPEELKRFDAPESWQRMEIEKDLEDLVTMDTTIHQAIDKIHENPDEEVEEELAQRIHVISTYEPECTPEVQKTSLELVRSLQSERRQSDFFENYLRSALKEGDLQCIDTENIVSADLPKFETPSIYLKSSPLVSPFSSKRFSVSEPIDITMSFSEPSLLENIDNLGREIDLQRRASDVFEQRLHDLIHDNVT